MRVATSADRDELVAAGLVVPAMAVKGGTRPQWLGTGESRDVHCFCMQRTWAYRKGVDVGERVKRCDAEGLM